MKLPLPSWQLEEMEDAYFDRLAEKPPKRKPPREREDEADSLLPYNPSDRKNRWMDFIN